MGTVQSFCGCGTLRQGAIIGGVISMIRGLLMILVGGCLLALVPQMTEEAMMHSKGKIEFEGKQLSLKLLIGVAAGLLLFGGVMVLVSILLFIGVEKSKPRFLKPWIMVQTMEYCLSAVLICILLALGQIRYVYIGPFGLFTIYLYIVVISYRKALLNPQTTQVPVSMQMTQVSIPTTGNPNQPACYVSLAGAGPPIAPPYGYPGMNPPVGCPAGGSPMASRREYPGSTPTSGCYLGIYDKEPGSPASRSERYPKMIPAHDLDHTSYPRMPTTEYYAPATGLVTTTENDSYKGFDNASPLRASRSCASPNALISSTGPYSTSPPPPYTPPPPPYKKI